MINSDDTIKTLLDSLPMEKKFSYVKIVDDLDLMSREALIIFAKEILLQKLVQENQYNRLIHENWQDLFNLSQGKIKI